MQKLSILSVLLLASCATMFSEKQQSVTFDSNEKNVSIYINNEKVCQTPCITHIQRSNNNVLIVAKKDGFEDKSIVLSSSFNPMSFVNALSSVTSTFGVSTDLSSGKIWEYNPNAFYISMHKETNNPAEKLRNQKTEELRTFILHHYSDIKLDAQHEGQKEYIRAISEKTNLSTKLINEIVLESTNDIDLSNKIVKVWHKK